MRSGLLSLVLAASAGSACSGAHTSAIAPTSTQSGNAAPAPSSVTLTRRVTESAPTALTGIEGAVVTISDGTNAGRSAVTNQYGFHSMADRHREGPGTNK